MDYLTGFSGMTYESNFGLKDKYTENLDIKLELVNEFSKNYFSVWINGKKEEQMKDESMSRY